MDTVTFTLQDVYGLMLGASGCIVTVSAAIGVIIKWVQAAKKPNSEQNARLDAIEKRLEKHDMMLANDDKRQANLEEGNRVTMEALLALLSHGIDGNDIEGMKKAKREIQDFLISK